MAAPPPGNVYHNIHISGNARVLLGNTIGQATGSPLAALADYTGQYAKSSLRPVTSYVPRPSLHQKIKEQLHGFKDAEADDARILVIYGLGGAGKSQLVLNYIRECRQDYRGVFWIEAGSKETIARDYTCVYGLLYGRQAGTGSESVKIEDVVPAVKHWFQGRQGRWLMVLDSADTIENEQDESYIDLGYFIPDAPQLHVVITTRSSTAKEMTPLEAIEVREMEPSEAIELFRRMARMPEAKPEVTEEIGKIARELGHLALAITLAGSYVSLTPRLKSDIKKYIPEYQQRRKEILQRRPKNHIHQYGESVLGTWEASFDAITKHDPAAARLLSLLAFLNFEDISISLLGMDSDDSDPVLDYFGGPSGSHIARSIRQTWRSFLSAGQKWTVYNLESCLETLRNYSLLQWEEDQHSYAMHKLVHAWGYDRLRADEQRQISWHSLELIAQATKQGYTGPSHRLRLMPHVMASFRAFSRLHESSEGMTLDMLAAIDLIGDYIQYLGLWLELYAIRLFQLPKLEAILGAKHPSTLGCGARLALVLAEQGKLKEAEVIQQKSLASMRDVLGEDHPETLMNLSNLAWIYSMQGKLEEAERMYLKTLAIRQSRLGEEHPDTLMSVGTLAAVYLMQGKHDEGERMYRKTMALNESVLGREHLHTLMDRKSLALALVGQGKFEEAEQMILQTLAGQASVLGEVHPETLSSLNNLARALAGQRKFEEAERVISETVAVSASVLGEEHPYTLSSLVFQATILSNEDKFEEAEQVFSRMLPLLESVLGKEHPDTLVCKNELAICRKRQGRDVDAISIVKECYELRRKVLGPDSLVTKRSLHLLRKWENEARDNENDQSSQRP